MASKATPEQAAAKFPLESLRKNCRAVFGVSSCVFAGATADLPDGEFLKVAITACIPAFTVIFGWGVNKAASIANSYVHNQFVQHCIQNAANAVFNAVSDVNQTYVDSLKESDKFDEAAQKRAFADALATAKKSLTTETILFIKETFGDVDAYLTPMIEAQVRSQKTYM